MQNEKYCYKKRWKNCGIKKELFNDISQEYFGKRIKFKILSQNMRLQQTYMIRTLILTQKIYHKRRLHYRHVWKDISIS